MNSDSHQQALFLLSKARIETLSASEGEWLNQHLGGCPSCALEAQALAQTIQSLRFLSQPASPSLVEQTRWRVRRQADELGRQRAQMLPLYIAAVLSVSLMAVTGLSFWSIFHQTPLTSAGGAGLMAFLLWGWFLPAALLTLMVAVRWSSFSPQVPGPIEKARSRWR